MINIKGKPLISNVIKYSLLAGSIALISACNDSDSKNKKPLIPDIEKTEIGVWSAPAYGWIFDIQKDGYKLYQTTSQYCHEFRLDESTLSYHDLIASIELADDKDSLISTIGGIKRPGVSMTRSLSLPKNCSEDLLNQQGDMGYLFNPEQDFEIFWQNFKEYYAFFNLENVDWDETYQTYVTQVSATTSQEELFEIFSLMVAPLKDFHVGLENELIDDDFSLSRKLGIDDVILAEYLEINELDEIDTQDELFAFYGYYEQQIEIGREIIANYLVQEDVKLNATETFIWSKTQDNLGYFYIESMALAEIITEGNSQSEKLILLENQLAEAFSDLKDTLGLIIDIRFNGGGDDFVSQKIMRHLIENKLHAYSKQVRLGEGRTQLQKVEISPQNNNVYIKPITLLTSSGTSSAAEIFSIAMRARENTALIGQSTAGGLSDMLPKSLPHGLQYSISNEIYISHDGFEFEGDGVPVKIEKPFLTLEQREQGKDLSIEAAIEWLQSQS